MQRIVGIVDSRAKLLTAGSHRTHLKDFNYLAIDWALKRIAWHSALEFALETRV